MTSFFHFDYSIDDDDNVHFDIPLKDVCDAMLRGEKVEADVLTMTLALKHLAENDPSFIWQLAKLETEVFGEPASVRLRTPEEIAEFTRIYCTEESDEEEN